jgi:hypothetical protein
LREGVVDSLICMEAPVHVKKLRLVSGSLIEPFTCHPSHRTSAIKKTE